jgi:hypothetical protein
LSQQVPQFHLELQCNLTCRHWDAPSTGYWLKQWSDASLVDPANFRSRISTFLNGK